MRGGAFAMAVACVSVTLGLPPAEPAGAGDRAGGRFCNPTPILPDGTTTLSPYPSEISVPAMRGAVVDVDVMLLGLRTSPDTAGGHWPEDLDILLSAPDGSTAVLMSDAGGDNINSSGPVTGADLTLDDATVAPLPADTLLTTGTYRPHDDDDDFDDELPRHADVWAPPAPAPSAASLSTFAGIEAGGVWRLWVTDDNVTQRAEFIDGGWCIEITTGGGALAPADFDGDGHTDVAVFRPAHGYWFVHGGTATQFGTTGDLPVPGDYDGDGDADTAVFRPANGYWFVAGGPAEPFGTQGDVPVPGDYDSDGVTDFAVFRPVTGYWFVHGGLTLQLGAPGDIPVPGDYDGDGDTDAAVFRPSSGQWFVHGGAVAHFGTEGDIPVPGDYDGDGHTDLAVFRPAGGHWFVQGGAVVQYGTNGDIPVPGDYDGDGRTDVAVFRASMGYWFLHGGAGVAYGTEGDAPLPLPEAVRRVFFA